MTTDQPTVIVHEFMFWTHAPVRAIDWWAEYAKANAANIKRVPGYVAKDVHIACADQADAEGLADWINAVAHHPIATVGPAVSSPRDTTEPAPTTPTPEATQ